MGSKNSNSFVQLSDILKAQQTVVDHIHRTPIVSSKNLGNLIGANIHFKAEVFQKTGSFKPRGALNKLHNLTRGEKDRGVVSFSAGNHAQGLAYAASRLGIQATVVMPQAAIKSKVNATTEYGAEVILHGTGRDLLAKCLEIQQKKGMILVHPFDDPLIIAGQGTVGLEILEDIPAPDIVVVPVGGGGLISGIATAIKSQNPAIKIIGVEPTGAAAMFQSLQKKKVVHLDTIDTIADGLAAPFAGNYTLAHVQKYVDEIVLVSDNEIIEALYLMLERCKILTEPAGAAGFAALLFNKVFVPKGGHVVCILSGGNINRSLLQRLC